MRVRRVLPISTAVVAGLVAGLLSIVAPAAAAAPAAKDISAGWYHTCAALDDGSAWCWGLAQSGQVGNGSIGPGESEPSPVRVRDRDGALTGVTDVSAGEHHSCAVKADGSAWCWGQGNEGQLGSGEGLDEPFARRVREGAKRLTDATAISTGRTHTCAVRSDRTARCWGGNESGQLGDGSKTRRFKAVQVRQGKSPLKDVRAVSAGALHTCALKVDGSVWCWGGNSDGQLGDGTTADRPDPVRVRTNGGNLANIIAISSGAWHTCAARSDGSAWCWGNGDRGQLGNGGTSDVAHAVRVGQGGDPLDGVVSITAGNNHSCAAKANGSAWCWGQAKYGQVGDGTTGDADLLRLQPVKVQQGGADIDGVTEVEAGYVHSCAVKANGTAWCWGRNAYGQLGDGTTSGDANQETTAQRVALP